MSIIDGYAVAVTLALKNNVSRGLAAITSEFGVLNRHIAGAHSELGKFESKMSHIQRMGALSAGIAGAGFVGLSLFRGPIAEAKELQNQISNLNVLGLQQAEISGVIASAWKTSRDVVTTTAAQNIQTFRELYSAFGAGHSQEALSILPQVQRINAVLDAVTGKHNEGVGFDIVKSIELTVRGPMSDAILKRRAELEERAIIGMGGTVDAHDFHAALKYAKSGAQSYSEDFMYGYLPTLIQEFKTGKHGGAQSAGTVLNSGYRMIVGQQISKDNFQNWMDAGLIDKSKVVANQHAHGFSKLLPGAVKGAELYAENPYEYAQKVLLPGIEHLMQAKKLTEEQAIQALTKDGNKSFLITTLINKAQQFERDRKMIEGVNGKDAYDKLIKTNPMLADMALQNQWKNLQAQLGYQILPDVFKGTIAMIDAVKDLTSWIGRNKDTTKNLVEGFGALAAAMAIGGALSTLAFGIKGVGLAFKSVGWISGAATALSGPLGNLATAMAFRGVGGATGVATLAGNLGTVGGQLGMLTKAAGVFMAAYAGWKMGEYIGNKTDEHIQKSSGYGLSSTRDWLAHTWFGKTTGIFDFGKDEALHFMQAPTASTHFAKPPPPPPQKPKYDDPDAGVGELKKILESINGHLEKGMNVSVVANLDGRKVASVLIPKNIGGTSGFNTAADRPTPGMGSLGLA